MSRLETNDLLDRNAQSDPARFFLLSEVSNREVVNRLGRLALALGRPDLATLYFEKAIVEHPEDAGARAGPGSPKATSSNVYVKATAPADFSILCHQQPGEQDVDDNNVGDFSDNCPAVANADQADADQDGVGDACSAARVPTSSHPGLIILVLLLLAGGVVAYGSRSNSPRSST